MESVNPATGTRVREYDAMSPQDIRERVQFAHESYCSWSRTTFEERAGLMYRAAGGLRDREDELALLMATEMGKPITEGRQEITKCALVCDYYAEHARTFLANERIVTDAADSYVAYRPLGVVLAIMPWNFPFWQVFRFAAPTIMAGNTGILKHASNVCGCALAIEDVFRVAGFPDHVFTTLLMGSGGVRNVIEHPHVAAVTLTGSTPAGQAVAAAAGNALKKSVLELGGSDPYVILKDADLDHAATACAKSRLINGGQSCIAAKRFIVDQAVRADFETRLVDCMGRVHMGDPRDDSTALGPQARSDLRDELHEQVLESVRKGSNIALGGEIPARPGAWYPPTVLTDVPPGSPARDDELFGPVAAVIEARDTDDAIRIANESAFGLGAAVFTSDIETGTRIAEMSLEAGSCFVNTFVRSDPRLPFGGIKLSGYGRELSRLGIREFVNAKTVYVA